MTAALLLPARAQSVRVFSYGGGTQSNAVLVLQATGRLPLPYDVFVFSNVGADSENPATLDYVERVAKPYAAEHGIRFEEVRKTTRGEPETLVEYIHRTAKSVPIPVYMGKEGTPGKRSCTQDWKVNVVDKWIRGQGYQHAVIGIGISLDEYHRARPEAWHNTWGKKRLGFWKHRTHPLIDLRLRRSDCQRIVAEAGLPVPPKSSCYFCPFKASSEWLEMKRTNPALFDQAVELEKFINAKRVTERRDVAYLHRRLVPLDQAVGDQLPLFPEWEMDRCESGYCMV